MESSTAQPRQISPVVIAVTTIAITILIVAAWFLTRPAPSQPALAVSPDARAYLGNLRLSDVTMKAADNLMRQQVVYIDGKITNAGQRPIERIDVYCIFAGVDGREVYRERVPVVHAAAAASFAANQTRSFELPFDHLPDTWNQALPRLVIAQIRFASR